jgi:tetratricopeptide (TPR) repeat protein
MLDSQMRLINTIVILFFSFSAVTQADATKQLRDAELLLKNNEVEDAISLYESILSEGYTSEQLYYNLGTGYTSVSQPGKAVLFLKKALKINPRHSEAKHNLEIARRIVDTEVLPIPEFFLLRYWRSISNVFSSGTWAILGLLSIIAGAVAFYFWLFGNSTHQKKKAFYGLLAGILLFLFCIAAGWSKYIEETTEKYAVIMDASPLFEGPDDRSKELLQLSPGVECVILDQINPYLKIKLRDQEIGWIPKEKVERI